MRFVSGNPEESTGQVGLPFFGLFEASAQLPRNEIEEDLLLGILLIFVGLGILGTEAG